VAKFRAYIHRVKEGWLSVRLFRRLTRMILLFAFLATVYWPLIASDRYVSEANVIIRKTDSVSAPSFDIAMLVSGANSVSRPEQLLLREYLLSVDMLKKLDAKLDLRSHYSNSERDLISRMWLKDAYMEWFHEHYLSRVDIVYDDVAGVLRIKSQAYDAQTAYAITAMLVQEGERYMNQLGHELAEVQVSFLTNHVKRAQLRFQEASQALLRFQNKQGLLSPQATAESINSIVSGLETQRTQLQTQLASLPRTLDRNHPIIVMLGQSLAAVDRQIDQEKAKLASTSGKTLNIAVEEFHRFQMEVNFTQDLYKSSLIALEKGRIDATRMLEKVSILQTPTLPEYAIEPRRIYNTIVTLLMAAMLAGIMRLLEGIVQDHVD
jgi:capsular polysaccharide transport system permease protein